MATRRGDRRERRDLAVFLLITLAGFGCLLFAAQRAVQPVPAWQVPADMLSRMNPDEGRQPWDTYVEPIRPEVMTPPPWNVEQILTPGGQAFVVPSVVFASTPAATSTVREVAAVTPSPTATSRPPTRTPTQRPTRTRVPTGTPTPTPTPTATPTPTPVPPPPTSTPTPSPTPTATPRALAPIVQALAPHTQVNTDTVDVTISGLNFQPGCSASLEGVPLSSPSCSPTTVLASVPTGIVAGYYDLTVTNPDSQSGILTDAYTATNPIPGVTAVTPVTWFNTMDVFVTITGSDFRNTGAPGGLQASLDGTALTNLSYVSTTTLRAEVPSQSAPMALGVYTLTVTNPGPTGPTGSLSNAFAIDTYTTTVTCAGSLLGACADAGGPPDGAFVGITGTAVITLDFGVGQGITHGPGYDMVFYERLSGPQVYLDYITIDISADGSTWYTVFDWDGSPGGVSGTNIDSYATDGDGEVENELIPETDLYPYPGTGISIDIQGWVPPGGPFHLVRLTYPGGSAPPDEAGEVDAIQPFY